jgi:2-polyprenyl-6-methoxyphenol hydroxylase-like FAD-dependent oxidoreductase
MPPATIAQVADHIEHVREAAGLAHVGIGADFDGTPILPHGLGDVSRYPALFHELQRRHWSEADLKALAGANILRALRDAESFAATVLSASMYPGDASVLIVGAGPIGMVLALELARLRVPTLLVDSEATTRAYPKGNTHNARTMEHYRRLGLAGQVRAVGLPTDHPTDVAYFTRLSGHELARLPMPSTAGKLAAARQADDFAQVIEPIHRANQMYVEKVLADACERSPLISVCRGWRAGEFAQREGDVELTVDPATGTGGQPVTVRGAFLVGCDGGRSRIRQGLGIRYAGEGPLGNSLFGGPMVSAHLRIPGLRKHLAGREFWQGWSVNQDVVTDLITLDGADEYMTHAALDSNPDSAQLAAVVARALACDVDVEVLTMAPWTAGRALVAEKFASGRVFLCGDSVHLFTPTGGLGMNTGIDDAANLAWKLAAVLHGWGGPGLLASYEAERHPVAVRNTTAARALARGVQSVEVGADIEEPGPAGDAERRRVGALLSQLGEEFASIGVQLGARYDGSPVVLGDGTQAPPDRPDVYQPSATPGGRLPHLRLPDGSSVFDRLGPGFTLLRTDKSAGVDAGIEALRRQASAAGVPLRVVGVDHGDAAGFYGAPLLLVRPDQHVAWRGARADDPARILATVTGNAGEASHPA